MTQPDAAALVAELRTQDDVAAGLGIEVVRAEPGLVELAMPAAAHMANGHGVVHGGYLFLLADTALAYCCASLGRRSLTRTADIAYLAPGRVGARLTAVAELRAAQGRTTICDVRVLADGETVAELRGHGAVIATAGG